MTRARPIPEIITVHVPFRLVKRGGRKVMLMPDGAPAPRQGCDNTMIKALARAFRWKKMLECGEFSTIAEIAAKEGLAVTYLTRVLRLTLMAPDIVETILDGRHPRNFTLTDMLVPFPEVRAEQELRFQCKM